jgi:bifunctional non-homologous end joining protein LigD
VAARSAVLDGELVVVDARGRADDEALRERLSGRPGRPVAMLVFDILHVDGRWLLNLPLAKRRDHLKRVLRPGDEVVMIPAIAGEGRALYDAVVAQGIAGVLARRRTSPYLPGVRSALWRSILAVDPAPGAGEETAARGETPDSDEASGTAPVLALFRRLPFLEDPGGE